MSAFVLYSFATRVLEIVVAVLFLTPFTIHQPEPLRKKLAAKLKAVVDEVGNGDSLVSGSLQPLSGSSSLSQALLPTVVVNKSYDKSYPRGINRDVDRRLPAGDGGSPGLSSMTESMSNKNKHTFAPRPTTNANTSGNANASASASASALMRPLSSPFVSTTTSTTGGADKGGAGTGGAGTNISAWGGVANGALKKVSSYEDSAVSQMHGDKEEVDRSSRPMEQTTLLSSSSMKRDGGLSVTTGMIPCSIHLQYK